MQETKYTRRTALAGMAGVATLPLAGVAFAGDSGVDEPIIAMAEELVTEVRAYKRYAGENFGALESWNAENDRELNEMWREAQHLTGFVGGSPTPTKRVNRMLMNVGCLVKRWADFEASYLPSPMRPVIEKQNAMLDRIVRLEAAIMTTKAETLAGAAVQLEVLLTIAYALDFSSEPYLKRFAEHLHCCLWSAARQAGLSSGSDAPMAVERHYSTVIGDPFAAGASPAG